MTHISTHTTDFNCKVGALMSTLSLSLPSTQPCSISLNMQVKRNPSQWHLLIYLITFLISVIPMILHLHRSRNFYLAVLRNEIYPLKKPATFFLVFLFITQVARLFP